VDTVFVLGAGFSAPARMPVQADIMRQIVTRESQKRTRQTIRNLFYALTAEKMWDIPLEDLFTVLDRARNGRETLVGFTHRQLDESYKTLICAIVAEFDRRLDAFDADPYLPFVAQLAERRASNEDAFSILTLNWDTILDSLLLNVDYGCETTRLDPEEPAPEGGALLLKLHGSLNWLVCTSCGRLFASNARAERPVVLQPYARTCRFCPGTELESLIITPTLLKNLSFAHLAGVWHRALVELQSAKRIVFAGYSLPLADFEFRYTLLRAVIGNTAASIRVVLYPPDQALREERERMRRDETEARYRAFFGARDLDFRFMDVTAFMADPILLWHW